MFKNNIYNSCFVACDSKVILAFDKICKSIATSKTLKQLESCAAMILNFINVFTNSHNEFEKLMKWLDAKKQEILVNSRFSR